MKLVKLFIFRTLLYFSSPDALHTENVQSKNTALITKISAEVYCLTLTELQAHLDAFIKQ